MIRVAVHKSNSRCLAVRLSAFFNTLCPLKFQVLSQKINEQIEGDQYVLFHTIEQIKKFSDTFETPKDVVDFMVENAVGQEVKTMVIGDRYYAIIDQTVYEFFEGEEGSI